jgi:CO/xanthine dehydrogenase FAD-binding subunit
MFAPTRLDEAYAALARGHCLPLAGGTDVYPSLVGLTRPHQPLLDLSRLEPLRGISKLPSGQIRIGALTAWRTLRDHHWGPGLQLIAEAAAEVGGLQIQNQGTLGGNLCNASPAADGVPALLALGAELELGSSRGTRRLSLEAFLLGNRRTARAADELLLAVLINPPSARAVSRFLKLGHRRYLVISIAMVGVMLDFDQADRLASAGIAVGACSAVARRLSELEQALIGCARVDLLNAMQQCMRDRPAVLAPLSPIDDVRGTAQYRRDAVAVLVSRAIAQAAVAKRARTAEDFKP